MEEALAPPGTGFDVRAFRNALGYFATGVTVISAVHDGQPVGMTANSFSSVSLEPPLILWSVARNSKSFARLRNANHFAVNVLASDQAQLAMEFARSGGAKFQSVPWDAGRTAAPLLRDVAAQFECTQEAVYEGGDHAIILGRVLHFQSFDRPVLLFAKGQFALPTEYPSASSADLFNRHDIGEAGEPFLRLTRSTWENLSVAFEAHRASEGINQIQAKVLARLAAFPRTSVDHIAKLALLDAPSAKGAVQVLVQLGHVAVAEDGRPHLTPQGEELQRRLILRAHSFENPLLDRFSSADIGIARKVLSALSNCSARGQ